MLLSLKRNMRIGIDATALPSRLFGAGNYIVNLIEALLRVDPVNEYVVFTKPTHASFFEAGKGCQVISVPLVSRVQRIAWEQVALPSLLRRYKLNVLHSPHYTVPFAPGFTSVATFHDMTFFLYPEVHLFYKRLFFRTMIRLAIWRTNAVIAISQSTRDDLTRLLNPPLNKIYTIPYGIAGFFHPEADSHVLAKRREYNLPEKFILYVGNLEPRKNLATLVHCFSNLVQRGLPHYLVLAGSHGWMDTDILATIEQLGIKSRVCFPGYIPQHDLPAVYTAAALFIYPSFYEGFGLPLLEAMACGVPVITSNVSSMPEVVGDAGIIVDPHNVDKLTDSAFRVLTNRELHDELRNKGLERAKSFSWEQTAKETIAVYEKTFSKAIGPVSEATT